MKIRKIKKNDVQRVYDLIYELAVYEKEPQQVTNSVEKMLKDGFGKNKIYDCFVAEIDGVIQGIALYYYRYSTWKGKRLYLEDLIVTEAMRGQGLGKLLFDKVIEEAKATECTGMMWQVLDWNEPAINFYRKNFPTRFDEGWINCHIDF